MQISSPNLLELRREFTIFKQPSHWAFCCTLQQKPITYAIFRIKLWILGTWVTKGHGWSWLNTHWWMGNHSHGFLATGEWVTMGNPQPKIPTAKNPRWSFRFIPSTPPAAESLDDACVAFCWGPWSPWSPWQKSGKHGGQLLLWFIAVPICPKHMKIKVTWDFD